MPEHEELFENPPAWDELWQGMPEFAQEDQEAWHTIKVHFRDEESRAEFSRVIGQKVGVRTRSIWFPEAEIGRYMDKRWVTDGPVDPKYPVYIVSKGRWESRLTAKALDAIGVPYRIVVESVEYANYAAVIGPAKILQLPFSDLGQGSIPARNWIWEHAVASGAKRHWILDDNIDGFFRLHENLKVPVATGAIFRAAEDFTDRYENIAISGFNYFMFAKRKQAIPPIVPNTRIYSCLLIRNDLPYRWRGRYNEDTDLSLRVLKDGWVTLLFNAFLAFKVPTLTMSGGNTDELYQGDGRLQMAKSLAEQHPDVVKITYKFGRAQHQVDYRRFRKNRPILRRDVPLTQGYDNYGMRLEVDPQTEPDNGLATP